MKISHLFHSLMIFVQILILCTISIFSIYKFTTDASFRTVEHSLVTAMTIASTTFLIRLYFKKVVRIKINKK